LVYVAAWYIAGMGNSLNRALLGPKLQHYILQFTLAAEKEQKNSTTTLFASKTNNLLNDHFGFY
jgi:hypothetical protein